MKALEGLTPEQVAKIVTADITTLTEQEIRTRTITKAMIILQKFEGDVSKNPNVLAHPEYQKRFLAANDDLQKDIAYLNDPRADEMAGLIQQVAHQMVQHQNRATN